MLCSMSLGNPHMPKRICPDGSADLSDFQNPVRYVVTHNYPSGPWHRGEALTSSLTSIAKYIQSAQ